MFQHPDLLLAQATDHYRKLIDEADQHRLLTAARRARKAERAARARPARAGAATGAANHRDAGNLMVCGSPAAAPATS